MAPGRLAHVRRSAVAAAVCAVVLASGCGSEDDFDPREFESPYQNTRVGEVLIRGAHLADTPEKPWRKGDDVPAHMWLYNEGSEPDRLVSATTPAAASVEIVDGDGERLTDGVPLPPDRLRQLERGDTHLVLRDLRRTVRGGDFVEFTVRFEDAGPVTFNIPARIPAEGPSPSR
ncbi:copper chaperone PCu(A)C [Streptomyces sparsus]